MRCGRGRRWGSPRLTWRLRRDGSPVNHKRIELLLREEHLLVRQRPRRKRAAVARVPAPTPQLPDERWSMDFVHDTLADGRPYRIWALVDDATRESPLLLVDRSLPAARIVEALDTLLLVRGTPQAMVCDNGPEFVSLALDQWATARSIRLDFIRPGHPLGNCFIESFNGKLRDECHIDTFDQQGQTLGSYALPARHIRLPNDIRFGGSPDRLVGFGVDGVVAAFELRPL